VVTRLPVLMQARLFWRRWTTRSSQMKLNKLYNSNTLLQWMSYSVYSTVGSDRLAQIHTAWFDYRRTIQIKLQALRRRGQLRYMAVWFAFRRRRNTQVVRKLIRWAKR
jgi:hypothetical protein